MERMAITGVENDGSAMTNVTNETDDGLVKTAKILEDGIAEGALPATIGNGTDIIAIIDVNGEA